ncbi:MAG TPA: hypothetical protein VJ719_14485 [Chthoniobacterales bacterium]|nr:hypothetical protein [Chthoniobacterales bacterium]
MPNYGYHLARGQARVLEASYRAFLPRIVRRKVQVTSQIPLEVFSYSSERRVNEQVASIRSFLKHAGRPHRFTVVSDGSHSRHSADRLRAVDQCVAVEQVPAPAPNLPAKFDRYLRDHPTGKQLALIMSLPRERPALYIDSDVLFFPGATKLNEYLSKGNAPAFYLQDCDFAGDERLLHNIAEKAQPVNTGVLLLLRRLDWSLSIDRFLELSGEPTFFTNQTMAHLTMHANAALPFDPATCVLQLDDQFVYGDRYAGPDLVLRHYVDPVRHKFWTSLTR